MLARTREAAEIGRRLEEARQQEATSRENASRVAQELSGKSAEMAQAEHRLQQTREAQEQAQGELRIARYDHERLTAERRQLEDVIASLTGTRDQLVAEQRRQQEEAQSQLARTTGELASRTKALADLEARINATGQELIEAQRILGAARQQLAPPSSTGSTDAPTRP